MTDEAQTPQQKGMFQSATEAISFDRIVVIGIMSLLFAILVLGFGLFWLSDTESKKQIGATLIEFYKVTAAMMVGGLLNSVQQKRGGSNGG